MEEGFYMEQTPADETGIDYVTGIVQLRALPTEREAIQYTGDNLSEISEWSGNHVVVDGSDGKAKVATNMGLVDLAIDWWVFKGVIGEYYPVDPKVVKISYERVENETSSVGTETEV